MLEAGKILNSKGTKGEAIHFFVLILSPNFKDLEEERNAEARKIYELHLIQYRDIIAKLQEGNPDCLKNMPGFTPGEMAERERTIVEEIGKISYSKRYQDSKYEYR